MVGLPVNRLFETCEECTQSDGRSFGESIMSRHCLKPFSRPLKVLHRLGDLVQMILWKEDIYRSYQHNGIKSTEKQEEAVGLGQQSRVKFRGIRTFYTGFR